MQIYFATVSCPGLPMLKQNSSIYMGLFVMMLGLYSHSRTTHPNTSDPHTSTKSNSNSTLSRIQSVYQAISEDPVFSGKVDGVLLIPDPSQKIPVTQDFKIVFQGDDAFSSRDHRLRRDFEPVLDDVADLLTHDPGLRIEISGYADANDPRENLHTESELSPHAFSFSRAEWVARYLSLKSGVDLQETFVLRGMGLVNQGKKLELKIHYGI
jgi:flagellar motor protein MotB